MKKVNINFVILFVGGVLLGFVLSYCTVKFIDSKNSLSSNNETKEDGGYVIYPSTNTNEKQEENNSNKQDNTNLPNEENNTNPVNYFEKINNSNDENVIKEGFVKIIDFIFYGTEINGYTFKSLTNEAKFKIMKIALSIDQKIEEIFPGYKETISTGAKTVYNNVKGFIVELYLDTVSLVCEKTPSSCELAKEGFENMKMSFGITWDLIKSYTNIGVDKLKEWYETFRG